MGTSFEKQKWLSTNYAHGYVGYVIRLALFVPLTIYKNEAKSHWHMIRDHPEPRNSAYGAAIAAGEHLAAEWGYLAYCWTIIVWIPFVIAVAPVNAIFSIIDTAITVYLFKVTLRQGTYSTFNLKKCNDLQSWQLPAGANETFYDTATRLKATKSSPTSLCEDYALERRYGLAIGILYLLLVIAGFFTAINAIFQNYKKGIPQWRAFYLTFFPLSELPPVIRPLTIIPCGLAFLGVYFAYGFPKVFVMQLTPWAVIWRLRYYTRYSIKAVLGQWERLAKRWRSKASAKADKAKTPIVIGDEAVKTPLTDFLGIYDMLVLVFKDLHYVDVMNLGLTSKRLREIVRPEADKQRLAHLKMYTCLSSKQTKRWCWLCTIRICDDCAAPCQVPQSRLYFHLDGCRLYCTPCYKQTIVARIPVNKGGVADKLDKISCKCPPASSRPNVWSINVNGTTHYKNRYQKLPQVKKDLCRNCSIYTPEEVLAKRRARTKAELRWTSLKKLGSGWEKCGKDGCENKIAETGPRWWVCPFCKWECKCLDHGQWESGEDAKNTTEGTV